MKVKISLTWGEWRPMYSYEDGYLSVGFGPIFVQFEWIDEGRI